MIKYKFNDNMTTYAKLTRPVSLPAIADVTPIILLWELLLELELLLPPLLTRCPPPRFVSSVSTSICVPSCTAFSLVVTLSWPGARPRWRCCCCCCCCCWMLPFCASCDNCVNCCRKASFSNINWFCFSNICSLLVNTVPKNVCVADKTWARPRGIFFPLASCTVAFKSSICCEIFCCRRFSAALCNLFFSPISVTVPSEDPLLFFLVGTFAFVLFAFALRFVFILVIFVPVPVPVPDSEKLRRLGTEEALESVSLMLVVLEAYATLVAIEEEMAASFFNNNPTADAGVGCCSL